MVTLAEAWAQTIAEGLRIQQRLVRERERDAADAGNVGLRQAHSLPTVALMAIWDRWVDWGGEYPAVFQIDIEDVHRVGNERGFHGYFSV